MGYTYQTRRALASNYYSAWKEAHEKELQGLPENYLKEIEKLCQSFQTNSPFFEKDFEQKGSKQLSLSAFMKQHYGTIVELFVSKKDLVDYYAILDEFVTFQYTTGQARRSFRTGDISCHFIHALKLMFTYMSFEIYGVSVGDYLREQMSEELVDFKRNSSDYNGFLCFYGVSDMIAARINAGDQSVISAIEEAILSENNTVLMSRDIILAIVKCKNPSLHELLGKFLVAARLSEGVRQVIAECADEGRTDCFIHLLEIIEKENLVRFAAIKRAFSVWLGFLSDENIDRLLAKVLPIMVSVVKDPEEAKKLLQTNDSIQILLGLWALSLYEVSDAMDEMKKIVKSGTREQKLAISYFSQMLQKDAFENEISSCVFEQHTDDLELLAAFMPTYMSKAEHSAQFSYQSPDGSYSFRDKDQAYIYTPIPISRFFPGEDGEQTARRHYAILKKNHDRMEKKSVEYSPIIFPWYGITLSKGAFVRRMAMIAYCLNDQDMVDEVCELIPEIDGQYSGRIHYVRMLLHDPKTEKQRAALINLLVDKDSGARTGAFYIVNKMTLREEEIVLIESFLKYKTEDIRTSVMTLLKLQSREGLTASVKRLVQSKNGNVRLAGFDILKTEYQNENETALLIIQSSVNMDKLTEQEKVLIAPLLKQKEKKAEVKEERLYDPSIETKVPEGTYDLKVVHNFFDVETKELDRLFLTLDAFLTAHGNLEYKNANGDTALLSNGLFNQKYGNAPVYDKYPFKELWQEFYDQHVKSEKVLLNMNMVCQRCMDASRVEDENAFFEEEKKLLPYCNSSYVIPRGEHCQGGHRVVSDMETVVRIMISLTGAEVPEEVAWNAVNYMASVAEDKRYFAARDRVGRYAKTENKENIPFTASDRLRILIRKVRGIMSQGRFSDGFFALRRLDLHYRYQKEYFTPGYMSDSAKNQLEVYDFIKAAVLGLIQKDEVYRYIFEEIGVELALRKLSVFCEKNIRPIHLRELTPYITVDLEEKTYDAADPFFVLGKEIYQKISNLVLDVELNRGDSKTQYSAASKNLSGIFGVERLRQIVVALGEDTLDRNAYYFYGSDTGKRACLSHLLQVSYPLPNETSEDLKKAKISEDRLVEIAMYAPQWIEMIEGALQCDGLKSGCYYFMAHMNERFDDQKKAIIAKYTPLSVDELNDGAFDLAWFYDAYNRMGDQMFTKLYKAAKYISDGAKHTRARKYADAALGKVSVDELEQSITDKRNKDLLMSYGIVPLDGEKDMLRRYLYIQKFLKESKKFGAQRRASEKTASDMALKNLATRAGYSDSLRLILAMECALVSENSSLFTKMEIGDYLAYVALSEGGNAELVIESKGKRLKAVPAALKKDDRISEMKEFASNLKEQYSRAVKMFERAMEERDTYSAGELKKLCTNPVILSILNKLIYRKENTFYTLNDSSVFVYAAGEGSAEVSDEDILYVAHPYDMYQAGVWSELQEIVFQWASGTKKYQPFKQVFRELYVKLDEEKESLHSRMFAGNQIQPKKTIGTLKNRRWIADYENGIQKVFYKDNIIATIYAMADWFSPSEIEAPTLEYVAFYDRKTFQSLKLSEIPDILYSEVMRDVDLAVSVAHAGGVDPETSHSTIELRKSIIDFNVKLFQLENVRLEGTHAYIRGKYGEYSVQLGSGVIHKLPGKAVSILPVHSQSRGKIFLPFIDEDPKTAEIMSKIVMLSEDQKIKDPYILNQIVG